MNNTLPPHSEDAEKSILGAILLDPDSYHKINLIPDDFYVGRNRLIFTVLQRMFIEGIGPDLVTLSEELNVINKYNQVGGAGYLAELIEYTPTAANIEYYARIVSTKSKQRQVIAAARDILSKANNTDDPDLLISESFAALQHVGQSGQSEKIWLTAADMAAEYESFIKSRDSLCFNTGFPDLDVVLGGVSPGEVMMIVGYSGTFKSAYLQNILINSAHRTGRKSLFFSMEMPANLVYQRTVQIGLEQSTYFIESGYSGRKPGYQEQTASEIARLGIDNLLTCPKPALTIEQVEHYSRLARARFGDVGVVGIDYLGLMAADGAKSEYERISYCAEQSKIIAKRLNMPVVILTQINRASARDGEIETWSAKGSGAVEASADYMLGIQRNQQKEIIVKILKNRSGEANLQFRADLDAKYLKFRSLEPYNEICSKNVNRGKERKANRIKEAAYDYHDPY